MNITSDNMSELIHSGDSAEVLRRMNKEDRLPKYKKNSLDLNGDCSDELKDIIRNIGMPPL